MVPSLVTRRTRVVPGGGYARSGTDLPWSGEQRNPAQRNRRRRARRPARTHPRGCFCGRGRGRPRARLVRLGLIVFAVGAVPTLATVAPLFLGADPLPSVAYFVCMLMGVGFALAAAGMLRSMAAQRRAAARVGRHGA